MSAEFSDPRLVAVYDTLNQYEPGTQPDFYLGLAEEIEAQRVIDVGCGTGLITKEFVDRGYAVTALDPAPGMIAVARRRVGEDSATWLTGGTALLGDIDADLAFLSGHVVQFFLTDEGWAEALTDVRRALRTGGRLAFETRNPAAREWEAWADAARRVTTDPRTGTIETWTDIDDVDEAAGIITCTGHYLFLESNEELTARAALRFRTLNELTSSLEGAGFVVERSFGDWDMRPLTPDAREFILVARAD